MSATTTYTRTKDSVDASINYYLEPSLGGRPDNFNPGTSAFYNIKHDTAPVRIHNIRGNEADFALDKQGFEVHRHTTAEKDFVDEGKIKQVVYPEVQKLLQETVGATKVVVFSHNIRRYLNSDVLNDAKSTAPNTRITKVPPANFAHVDNGPEGSLAVMNDVLPAEDAAKLRKSRWAVINVWRPISPIQRDPLAVCDFRSVEKGDLVPVHAVPFNNYANYAAGEKSSGKRYETLSLKANPKHQWYFASGMTPDEVLMLKIFDTRKKPDGTHQQAPHCAFEHSMRDGLPPRESIEVRTLVFWEDQPL